jgi:pimeloyl-ACP methyl ester carboxylesterase
MRRTLLTLIAIFTVMFAAAAGLTGRPQDGGPATGGRPPVTPTARSPLSDQLAWALTQINGGAEMLAEADVVTHFAPAVFELLPPEDVPGYLQGFVPAGPYAVQGFTRPPTATQATALATAEGGSTFVIQLAIEADAPHRITGLTVQPVPAPAGVTLVPLAVAGGPDRFDRMVDIGGRRLYLTCRGSGGPTVVLESAQGDAAAPWFAVESAVARFTRVCSYDRPNTLAGASDPAAMPRTAADAVADLHALLAAAEVPGPYVLVGHTLGGIFARLYASTHPSEVAGLVLVDASHEEADARLEALLPAQVWQELQELVAQSRSTELLDLESSSAQMRAARAAAPLRPMPLVVIADVRPPDPSDFPPHWPLEVMVQELFDLQVDLAGLVPGAALVTTEAGNYVHQAEPELVVDSIRRVVEAVRR